MPAAREGRVGAADARRGDVASAPRSRRVGAADATTPRSRRVDAAKLPPALAPLFNPAVQGFLVSTFALDPAVLAGKIAKPLLIVQGQRDLQVSVTDAQRLKQAAPRATLVTLPDTNHVLKQVGSDERSANLATYAATDLPLAPGVVDGIARFVASH